MNRMQILNILKLKTLISSIIPRNLNIYQVTKHGGALVREGASIRTNTVCMLQQICYFTLQQRYEIDQSCSSKQSAVQQATIQL